MSIKFWDRFYPDQRLAYASDDEADAEAVYTVNGEPANPTASPASTQWRDYATFNLKHFVELLRGRPYSERIIGLIPMYYQTGEWVLWKANTPSGFSEVSRQAFIDFAKRRYGDIDSVNRAWDTDYASFEAIRVPGPKARRAGGRGIFRHPRENRRAYDFLLMQNRQVAELAAGFAGEIKKMSDRRLLVGLFFGYLYELAFWENWPQQAGHTAFARALRSPHVDIIGAPYSYNPDNRAHGLPAEFHTAFDSINLHGKLVMFEEDTFTHMAREGEEYWAPGYAQRTETLSQSLDVLRRNLGVCLAHGFALHWQALLADDRFSIPEDWAMYQSHYPLVDKLLPRFGAYRPEVAVVADPEAYLVQRMGARAYNVRWMYRMRSYLSRVDTTLGFYLQSDLDKLPDSVRAVVVLTPFTLSEAEKTALRRWQQDGRMIVHCALPDLSLEAADLDAVPSFANGMKVRVAHEPLDLASKVQPNGPWKPFAGTTFGEASIEGYPGSATGGRLEPLQPHAYVDDERAQTLARYTANGRPSAALLDHGDWTEVFLGPARIPAHLWRELFARAGAHLYLDRISRDFDNPDFVQANRSMLMVQPAETRAYTIRLPDGVTGVRHKGQTLDVDDGTLQMKLTARSPVLLELERKDASTAP